MQKPQISLIILKIMPTLKSMILKMIIKCYLSAKWSLNLNMQQKVIYNFIRNQKHKK